MLTTNVKILQKAVLIADNRVLILKRSDESVSRAGKWDLPGGNSEWPQTDVSEQGLHRHDIVREIAEETGVVVTATIFSHPIFFDTYFDAENQIYTCILGWKVVLKGQPKVIISSEHSEFSWISPAEFPLYDFGFAGGKTGFVYKILERSTK